MTRQIKILSMLIVAFLVFGSLQTVTAGTKGRLIVTVVDEESGAKLPGVKIKLVSEKSSARFYNLETNEKGKATLSGVEPDMYSAEATKDGYLELKGKIKLRVGVKVKVEWKMQTLEFARAEQIRKARDGMTEEELSQLDASDAHNAGMEAYQNGDMAGAKMHFEKAIGLWEDVSYVDYLLLGQFAGKDKDVTGAIKYLDKALDLLDKDILKADELTAALAAAEPGSEEAKKLEEEKTFYDQEALTVSKMDVYRLLGASYMIQENYDKVKELWGALVAETPDQNILFNLANIGIKENDFDYAIKNLKTCCEHFPEYADAQMLLGDLYIQKNDYVNALKSYENYLGILEKTDNVSPEILKNAKDMVKSLKEIQKKK